MNKFKFLALSLVCATIAFGYNPSNAMNNDNVMNAVDNETTSPKEIAYQILYKILNNGIEKYQNMQHGKEQKILEYASNVIHFMKEEMQYRVGGNFSTNEVYIKGMEEWEDCAQNTFEKIVELADEALKYDNGADENTKKKLIDNILKELANFSKDDMLMILR